MAYTRRSSHGRGRTTGRRSGSRTPDRSRSVRRPARRRSTGRASGARTIRIEVVQSAQPVARPEIGMKPASAPRKSVF